jgi:hypothetical protein
MHPVGEKKRQVPVLPYIKKRAAGHLSSPFATVLDGKHAKIHGK